MEPTKNYNISHQDIAEYLKILEREKSKKTKVIF